MHPLSDESPVSLPGYGSFAVEQTQNPVGREKVRLLPQARSSAIATPSPGLGLLNESRTHRIQYNIAAQLKKVVIFLYQDRLETPLKDVTGFIVPSVISLGIDAVELAHAD
jgi:hypothetical protein